MTEKYLYFMETSTDPFNAAGDMAVWPLSSFKGFHNLANGKIQMDFKGMQTVNDSNDTSIVHDFVVLDLATANKNKEAIADIIDTINGVHSDGFIVIADDNESKYASTHISGCTITITAEG